MFKRLLFISTASLVASQAFAGTPPTFYGTIYLDARALPVKTTKTYEDGSKEVEKTTGRVQLFDNGSRAGIRGSEDINADTELQYRFEWRSPVDDTSRNFEARDTWLGVKHKKYGTIKAGRLLSPEAYFRYTWDYPTWGADSNRSNNAIRYESPKFNDTEIWLHYVMDENKDETDLLGRDGFGIAIKHEKEDKYGIAAAYFSTNSQKSLHGVKFKDQARVSGFYNLNPKTAVNFIYQYNKFNDIHYGQPSKANSGLGVGVSHKLSEKDSIALHLQSAKNPFGKDGDFKSFSIGAEHQFTPKFTTFLEYSHYVTDVNVPTHLDDKGATIKGYKEKTEEPTFIIGTSLRF